jgi:cytochrome o ubiquinol oxidase operon protein cyoD
MEPHIDMHEGSAHGSISSYVVGFVISLLCTIGSFGLVIVALSQNIPIDHMQLIAVVVVLAITQLIAQLVFFLHLGKGSQSWWNLSVFGLALLFVCIVVGGSLWIMSNLNNHTSLNDMYVNGIVTPENQEN